MKTGLVCVCVCVWLDKDSCSKIEMSFIGIYKIWNQCQSLNQNFTIWNRQTRYYNRYVDDIHSVVVLRETPLQEYKYA